MSLNLLHLMNQPFSPIIAYIDDTLSKNNFMIEIENINIIFLIKIQKEKHDWTSSPPKTSSHYIKKHIYFISHLFRTLNSKKKTIEKARADDEARWQGCNGDGNGEKWW